ncbi:efflux RND transporter permease subunit [Synergistes jonesii]|uniref:Acriflavin resistance protein n=1 Tax=Synergistes jonesii TaxID=2754 RepID=A0A073ISV5_9BACT|nr:efflux RND transporter permease subunit [Synergistes jonesii]KEJ93428.1 acriflavin resistance protein [Synergistes jonesii]OFB60913.1 acriflavin resistance protein [Synergistes jonesii]OFB65191.1 acriflavin resistance protein [Synergistes jonesii]OFB66407.1 acriflavin resistance protein [Synergistes jonesii]OFB69211.1 acriflavin resistance protein [Synergistes jonesii]
MKITELSLRRPVTVLILTIATVVFGVYSYRHLGVERMPNVEFPIVVVRTAMEGASPAIIDNDVTDVLEARINTIEGIKNLSSSSYEGRSVIVVEFELDRNVDFAAADVRGKVSMATNSLPDDCDDPQVDKFDPSDRPIMNIAVKNDGRADMKALSRFVDKIVTERLQTVRGVGGVQLAGFRDREMRVWLRPKDLENYRLTTKDIKNAIYNKHVELPAGRVETGTREYGIRIEGEYSSAAELEYLPVAVRNGAVIRLRDVARIEDGFEDKRSGSLYEGRPTIMVMIRKQKGANEVFLSRLVRERVGELNKIAPPGANLVVVADNAKFIVNSMNGVFWDIVASICLTSIIMFLFLRTIRATFVAVITIPVCLLGSMSVLYWMGITINNMSMMGLSLAVGMVVDATTVVMENISRHKEGGKSAFRAAEDGTGEVAFAVLAGAATTLAVFVPVAFMGGMMGRFFNSFGVTVATTISISLLISLTLTPFLCSRILGRGREPSPLQRRMEYPFLWLESRYRAALGFAVRHRKSVMGAALGLFILGIAFASSLGTEFFPSEDQGRLRVQVELPADTALEVTEQVTKEMVDMIQQDDAVAYTYGVVGSGAGEEIYKSTLNIELIDRHLRPRAAVVMKRLREKLVRFRDADIKMGTWGGSDITLVIQGPTSEALADLGELIKKDLAEHARGLVDITTDLQMKKPRINLALNRALADDLNISIRDLSDEMLTWFAGDKSGSFNEGGYRYDITIRAEKEGRDDPEKVLKTLITTKGGKTIPAEGIVKSSIGNAPNVIKRYNRQRSLQIGANVEGISPGDGIKIMEEVFRKYAPQDGTYSMVPAGDSEHMKESFGYMSTALVFAIILVYMVMAIQFESFVHPFTVMFSLPLMTAGSFGLLALTGLRLSVMSFMGIILLVGVVVNNAILLVDFINQLRAAGDDKVAAVVKAGPLRLRAILMTTVSTMMGSLPVALALSEGGETRQPMSVAVIGGLFTSTLLTLFVIPVVYLILDDAMDWSRVRLRRYSAYRRLKRQGGGVR